MRTRLVILGLCALVLAVQAEDGPPRGHLVIIGGGRRGPEIMNAFVRLAGAERSRIIVLPMASALAGSAGPEQIASLRERGAAAVVYLNISRAQADEDSVLRLLDGATGVFFPGGDQSRLIAALKGTRLEQRLHSLYRTGAVIGGTSAGAAVMSAVMITGDERVNGDSANAYSMVRSGNIVTAPGFGFVDEAIIDQHFIRRRRFNRLLSVVLEHRTLVGIGIDEATAIIWNPDRTFDVVGDGTVLVIDPREAQGISTDERMNLSASDLRLHLLRSGDAFDLATGKVRRK